VKKLYLASASPRRKELLALTGLDFEVRRLTEVDEDALLRDYEGDVIAQAEFLALKKAEIALDLGLSGIFVTADTLVVSDDGAVLGKPQDVSEATMFLDRLAGNWHTVATGVALAERGDLVTQDRIESILERTRVKFAPMTDKEIEDYISSGEPFDKAGGYGIQGRASKYIERIDGCYFNVVGFPVHSFWELWRRFNDLE